MILQTNIDGKLIQNEVNATTRKMQRIVNDIIALKLPNEKEVLYVLEQAHNKKVREIASIHLDAKAPVASPVEDTSDKKLFEE